MPSRSNPNTPTSLKPKTAGVLKSKRRQTQRLARNKSTKATPRTSQALRQAAPLSNKKAKKVEKKIGHARRRATGTKDVDMRDVVELEAGKVKRAANASQGSAMDVE